MRQQILSLATLFVGAAFLFFAGGMNGLLLPVRGSAEGFSDVSLGFLGTGWAVGFVTGCLLVPRLVAGVGHIRSFSAMAATAALSILFSALLIDPIAWIILRSLAGFAFAGAAMIVESWLSERTDTRYRGTVFGIYTMVNLSAITLGQLSLAGGGTSGLEFFILAAAFYCLALIPTAVSSTSTPKPLAQVKLDIPALWRNSPVAVVAVFFVGMSNSSFGTLGAVFGEQSGLEIAAISLFVSISILAGAIAQVPVGIISDRVDRRLVLVIMTAIALVGDLIFVLLQPQSALLIIATGALFGGALFTLYPIVVAHANDHAAPGDSVKVSGGLLLIFGVGSIAGPLLAGIVMSFMGPRGLFIITLGAHIITIVFALWRMRRRQAVDQENKGDFVMASPARTATPETVALSSQEAAETPNPREGAGP
ncbi:MAG: MFS transporter [Alphaproteobacteria bacterium]|nr:MFS transporter [Alphaproteobacteria bacterium]